MMPSLQIQFRSSNLTTKRNDDPRTSIMHTASAMVEICGKDTEYLTQDTIDSIASVLRTRGSHCIVSISMRKVLFRPGQTTASRILLEYSLLTALFTFPSSLVSLELDDCGLQDSFAVGMAHRLHSTALQTLRLPRNSISDIGAEALARSLPHGIEEFDLSRNRLTQQGILEFANLLEAPTRCPRLKVLHLAYSSHCMISLSTFHRFASIIEGNSAIQSLTLGNEVLNWFNDTVPQEWKEMDAFLAYWWLEPAYRSVTDRIRFLLVINHAFDGTKHSVHSVLSRVQPKQQAEAMYRMLKRNPTMLLSSDDV